MNFMPPDFAPAYPEIFLLVMVCVVLLADIAWGEKKPYVAYLLSQITLLGCALITFGTSVPGVVYTFSGMFVDDAMADILKMLVYITVATVLVYSRAYISVRGMLSGEFFSLALFATLGMMVMISASHFLTLYLGLELLSLSLYAMVALRRESAAATEAAIKFFVLGALASGFLLYGMSMIYGATGSLNIARVTEVIQGGVSNHAVLVVGLVFIVAGISFKLSAAPFHMWAPDVYQGAPTAVVLFIGAAPKLAAFGFVMRLLVEGMGAMVADWQGMLVILAVMSMMIGNLAAIAQTNIKRMLAYSTISHMGFMLLGFIATDENGYSASMFYVVVYILMTLGTFGMIMLLSREGFEADKLDDFKGLNRRNPWYAFITLLLMFSMAGVPPTVGIYAKLSVLQAVLSAGYIWLAVVAVLFSLIGAFYYLRIVKLMYFDEPETDAPILPESDVKLLISANGLAILAFGLFPQALMALCAYAIQQSI
ncbi:NADH dehydrogenase subunit N [Nitrosospira sp. Nsp5]|uniref:NADH-quinone oxidoreductase subunit N n=1 Tax=Nitrosospira multiformis TaxID=1231 RepID=A0ABY0TBJ9_9PROT|nr:MULTISPECIES: NADH-quinone oxidoreductase subunit NuoN [Nitrosospira]PTR06307.1 NADH dehydrogenase subunit N [Nitrosospira sp. Nsp5]SDQ58284.1 NADH dehydrogenase subunit N [Nitrosospira multiformis]